jgi:hypothetical protein
MDRRDKPKRKILIHFKIFAERLDMSRRVTGQVQKTLLESGVKVRHIQ